MLHLNVFIGDDYVTFEDETGSRFSIDATIDDNNDIKMDLDDFMSGLESIDIDVERV